MNMTPSLIRCLLAVLALSETYPHVASKDVAHLLGVKKPTVHHTLETLRGRELIDKELYGDVHLTETGLALARKLAERRDDLSVLFARQYNLPPGGMRPGCGGADGHADGRKSGTAAILLR